MAFPSKSLISYVRFEHVDRIKVARAFRARSIESKSHRRAWNPAAQRGSSRWALEAFPRKRFPRALFSRTSHRHPPRRNHPQHSPPNSPHLPTILPQPLKLSLFHSDYRRSRHRPHHRYRRLLLYYLHTSALRFYAAFTPFSRSSRYSLSAFSRRKTTLWDASTEFPEASRRYRDITGMYKAKG